MTKRHTRIIGAVLAIATLGLVAVGTAFPPSAHARGKVESGDTITQSQVVHGSYFGSGSNVQLTNTVEGDAYIVGQNVTISGTVTGDLLVAAQTVTVNGTIEGNAHILAQTVTVTGPIKGSLSTTAQTLTLNESAKVGQDVAFATQTAILRGSVGRDIQAFVQSFTLSGSVGRDVDYMSDTDVVRGGATIGGVATRTPIPAQATPTTEQIISARIASFLYTILALGFAMLLAGLLIPRQLVSALARAYPRPWKAVLVGLVILAVAPLALLLLAITIIGLPVALFGGLLLAIVALFSSVFTSLYIGRFVHRGEQSTLVQGLTGALVYGILLTIPVINFFASLFGVLFGTGIASLAIYHVFHKPARHTPTPVTETAAKVTK